MPSTQNDKPLALNDTLRDLAILRASDINLSSLLASHANLTQNANENSQRSQRNDSERDEVLKRSYTFVREAKEAMKIMNSGLVDIQGERIEEARAGLEEIMKGLEGVSGELGER